MFKHIIFLAILLVQGKAYSQGLGALFSPRSPNTQLESEYLSLSEQNQQDHSVNQALYQGEKNQFFISGEYTRIKLKEVSPLPEKLEVKQAGLQYKRNLTKEKFWSVQASYGSASDRTFKGRDVSTISANFLYRASARWLFLANYSNNRSFLNNIPLPSVMYAHTMTREKTLLIGVPFFFYRTPLLEGLSFSYQTFIPYNHKIEFNYRFNYFVQSYLGVEQKVQTFLKYKRQDEDDRLYLSRKKVYLGLIGSLGKKIKLDVQVGHAFDQSYFESDSYSDKGEFEQHLKDGPYFMAALNLNF